MKLIRTENQLLNQRKRKSLKCKRQTHEDNRIGKSSLNQYERKSSKCKLNDDRSKT